MNNMSIPVIAKSVGPSDLTGINAQVRQTILCHCTHCLAYKSCICNAFLIIFCPNHHFHTKYFCLETGITQPCNAIALLQSCWLVNRGIVPIQSWFEANDNPQHINSMKIHICGKITQDILIWERHFAYFYSPILPTVDMFYFMCMDIFSTAFPMKFKWIWQLFMMYD